MTTYRPNASEWLLVQAEQNHDLNQPALLWWQETANDDELAKHYDRLAASKGISFTPSHIGA